MDCFDFVDHYLNYTYKPVLVDLERSHDNFLVCKLTGKEYLDCCSFFASNPVGYNHPDLKNPEFEQKLLRVAKIKPCNGDFLTEEFVSFLQTLIKICVSPEFSKLFFIEGGTLAVENALKCAFDWKLRKSLACGKRLIPNQLQVLHLTHAYHGRSGYCLSLTNSHDLRKTKYFPKFDWVRCPSPAVDFDILNSQLPDKIASHMNEVSLQEDAVIDAIICNKQRIAAVILEPIQGEGGDRHFRPEFHKKLREATFANDVLLIYDEIQTGVGITGRTWAYQHYGVCPDILCFGKKLQVCGIMATDRVMEVTSGVFEEKERLDSTWNGSLVDMVRAEHYLKIIKRHGLIRNAEVIGSYLKDSLLDFKTNSKVKISGVRGLGLMCAFDLPTGADRDLFASLCTRNGLLVMSCGKRGIRLRPSLTFSYDDVDLVLEKIDKSLMEIGSER